MVTAIGWKKEITTKNRYMCSPLLVTCVVLRRLTTPACWRDMEMMFGKHGGQLSEIFWEGMESLARQHLVLSDIDSTIFSERAELSASAIKNKCEALDHGTGFIDGTVIAIARPSRGEVQNVAYNGHKRKHALKYQAITSPDGLVLLAAGPIEGRMHDWTLYCRSRVDDSLPGVMYVGGKQYCIYGDSGYNQRPFLEVPYHGSSLSAAHSAFNGAMSRGRVTVEWYFKEVKLYWSTMDYKSKMQTGGVACGSFIYRRNVADELPKLPLPEFHLSILPLRTSHPGKLLRPQTTIHCLLFQVIIHVLTPRSPALHAGE